MPILRSRRRGHISRLALVTCSAFAGVITLVSMTSLGFTIDPVKIFGVDLIYCCAQDPNGIYNDWCSLCLRSAGCHGSDQEWVNVPDFGTFPIGPYTECGTITSLPVNP